jgi:hypothetical protein
MGSPYFVWKNTNEIISSWYSRGAGCVTPPGEARGDPGGHPEVRRQVGPEVGPTIVFCSCISTGMRGSACIFWADPTPFSLQADRAHNLEDGGAQGAAADHDGRRLRPVARTVRAAPGRLVS